MVVGGLYTEVQLPGETGRRCEISWSSWSLQADCELPAMGYWDSNSSPLEVQHSDHNHQDVMPAPQNE